MPHPAPLPLSTSARVETSIREAGVDYDCVTDTVPAGPVTAADELEFGTLPLPLGEYLEAAILNSWVAALSPRSHTGRRPMRSDTQGDHPLVISSIGERLAADASVVRLPGRRQ